MAKSKTKKGMVTLKDGRTIRVRHMSTGKYMLQQIGRAHV